MNSPTVSSIKDDLVSRLKEGRNFMDTLNDQRTSIAVTCIGITIFLLDVYTDVVLGVIYLREGDKWNGLLTLVLVVTPAFFNSIYTATLHYTNNGKFIHNLPIPSLLVYPFCAVLHGQLSRLFMWIYFMHSKILSHDIAKDLVWLNRDVIFYPEVFIQSIPQLYLQFYIVIILKGYYTPLQLLSCCTSLIAASWAVLMLFDKLLNKFAAFQMSAFWFVSRIAAIATIASINKVAPFLLLLIHFLVVLPLWFYEIQKLPFQRSKNSKRSRWQVVITDTFYAVVYAVCNTATPIISAFYFPLSILFLMENIGCYIFAYQKGSLYRRNITNNGTLNKVPLIKIPFKNWRHHDNFFIVCSVFTCFAFLQCLVIFALKYKNIIKGDFFHSQIIVLIKAIKQRKEQQVKRDEDLHIGTSISTITTAKLNRLK